MAAVITGRWRTTHPCRRGLVGGGGFDPARGRRACHPGERLCGGHQMCPPPPPPFPARPKGPAAPLSLMYQPTPAFEPLLCVLKSNQWWEKRGKEPVEGLKHGARVA